MKTEIAARRTTSSDYPHPVAFSIQLSRNMVVQVLGLTMVTLMGLSTLPGAAVAAWLTVAVATLGAENWALRIVARDGGSAARTAARWALGLRIMATTLYALAALALIAKGGPGERMFAFALMSASLVHVLMRYYRSPAILIASISPYMIVFGLVGVGLTRTALEQGHYLAACASIFTIGLFTIQIWSARAQLAAAWIELMATRDAAEARERTADAANRAKSEFLANMSHELRTPLNGVLGMAQALTSDRLTRIQRERVGIIRRSSENLLSVLNDLLDLSKIETSSLDLDVGEFDLEHLVRGVVAAYRPLAAKKGLSFEFQLAEAALGRYRGDSARIRRILYSLADNAVKFTETGGVTLGVDLLDGQVVFRVSDTGIGIGQTDLARLFEGFFQADASLTRRYGGAGIGLAVCKELTTLMGGAIDAESSPEGGAVLTLRLPLARVEPTAEQPAADGLSPDQDATGQLQVLAAEDNEINQLVLKALLAAVGILPTLVENGREALEAWENQDWDIVLMDIQMPQMNGIEATRAIRDRERQTGRTRTPILAVTANAMAHQVAEYELAGMDGVVAKPLDMTSLFAAIEQVLAVTSVDEAQPQRHG